MTAPRWLGFAQIIPSSLQSPPSSLLLDVLSPSLSLSLSVSLAPEVTCRPRRCSTAGVRVLFGGAAAKAGAHRYRRQSARAHAAEHALSLGHVHARLVRWVTEGKQHTL